eukprot:11163414-Lingulodinium_polyedra.AAC.1
MGAAQTRDNPPRKVVGERRTQPTRVDYAVVALKSTPSSKPRASAGFSRNAPMTCSPRKEEA